MKGFATYEVPEKLGALTDRFCKIMCNGGGGRATQKEKRAYVYTEKGERMKKLEKLLSERFA